MRRLIGGLLSLAFLVIVIAAGAVWWLAESFDRPGPGTSEIVVVVPSGAGVSTIARLLESAGAIPHAEIFVIGNRLFGGARTLKAGEYALPAGSSPRDIMTLLADGRTLAHRLTVPEGLTVAQVIALIEAEPRLAGAIEGTPPEGALLPDTYHFSTGDTRVDVVARMSAAMAVEVERLWAERAAELPFDSVAEAIVLASIVEKETGVAEERRHVAGVFVNRLRQGMRLQSDPTVIYGLTNGKGPLDRLLTRDDLAGDTPYNTYQIDGLPPTPIANPGIESIAAVLDPLETKDMFFVADGSGGHVFARTLKEHNRNVAAWRKLQRQSAAEKK